MVTIKCQHSGIEFEAKSKRTKQHPRIAELKADANKRGNYREVDAALDAVRKAGGYATIEEYLTAVRAHLDGKQQQRNERAQRQARAEQERKQQQETDKATLKAHGYERRKVVEVMNDDGQGEYDLVDVWYWFSPDGRQMGSQLEALNEIKYGVEEMRAQHEREAIRAAALVAIDASQKAWNSAAYLLELKKFDAEAERIREQNQSVKRGAEQYRSAEWTTLCRMSYNRAAGSYRSRDRIERATINGQTVYCITTGSGYDDDGYTSYYCADPAAAGLAEVNRDDDPLGLDATLSRFF